jgi:excinuclease ABC subunit C
MEIPRNSEAIFLLRQIRDEAHRFAIGFHRQLRAKRMTRSVLDDIDGLGEKRRQKLLRHFGSITKLKEASYEDLELCSWLPKNTRDAIWEKLHHMPKGSL